LLRPHKWSTRVEGPDLDIPELLILWPNSIAQRRASVQLLQQKSPVADKRPYDSPWRMKMTVWQICQLQLLLGGFYPSACK